MRLLFLILLSSLFFSACTGRLSKQSPKEKFDQLEKIFAHANWLLMRPKDTTCFYFERMSDTQYDVYQFRMTKGDSSGTSVSLITATGDSVRWDRRGRYLLLDELDSSKAEWMEPGLNKTSYTMHRVNDSQLVFRFSGQPEMILHKTPPLMEFLVGSKREYERRNPALDSALAAPVQ